MTDRILIATDGSDESQAAIDYGGNLAELADSEVHILYVVETQANYILSVGLQENELEEYREFGRETVREATDYLKERGIGSKGIVRTGAVAQEIVDYADDEDIDHIVVGRQGRGAVEQYLGSTAEKVVRMSHVPVTVVRTGDL